MSEEKANTDHHIHHHHPHQNEQFDPHKLFDAFDICFCKSESNQDEHDDVILEEYLKAYEEISKFLNHLGTIFYFVITDICDKVNVLRGYIEKSPQNYITILNTVKYEKFQDMFENGSQKNASRNILRLHRALIFIYKFLENLHKADNKCKTSHVCTDVYDKTLGKHHSWMIRKAARWGMMTLPKRDDLMKLMIKDLEDEEKFQTFIRTVEKCYNITQKIYEKYNILELP
jgi:hypothetical protein